MSRFVNTNKRVSKVRWKSIGKLLSYLHCFRQWTRRYTCAKFATASRNTQPNANNLRPRKGLRVSGHHAKHYAFKYRFNLQ
jgi:hypothetical protein